MTVLLVCGNKLSFAGKEYRCAIGRNGFAADKKEGDGCTPLGVFPLRECWYRADKIPAPQTSLPLRIIRQKDGWCDAPESLNYNKHVCLPYNFSHEKLWRDDEVYDLVMPIGYNDAPVISGKGSAIFLHIARNNYELTEGCIALKIEDLLELLPLLSPQTYIDINKVMV